MAGRWRIQGQGARGWVIQAGPARCVVRPDLGRALLPLAGSTPDRAAIQDCLADAGWGDGRKGEPAASLARELFRILGRSRTVWPGPGRRAIWLRLPVIPAVLVRWLARQLAPLAATPSLTGMVAVASGLYAVGLVGRPLPVAAGETSMTAALALFFLLGVWHELGHASALCREGYPPGGIGLGVLFVLPVLFADVSPVAALPRGGRVRVDLGGVCFQLGAGGWLYTAGAWNPDLPGAQAMQLAGLLVLPAVVWSLLPFIRADGYWFLADLLNLADLERPARPASGRGLRAFLIGHRIFNSLFLLLVGVALPWRYHGWLAGVAAAWGVDHRLATGLLGAVVLLVWWGLVNRLLLLVGACREDLRRWQGSPDGA